MKPFVFDHEAFTRDFNQWRGERTFRSLEENLRHLYGLTVSVSTLSRVGLGGVPDLPTIGILCAAMHKHPGDYWQAEGDTESRAVTELRARVESIEVSLEVAGIRLYRKDAPKKEGR